MNSLMQLIKCGQSFWLDDLTRKKITSGELGKLVKEKGLRGITSNPSIFQKAISKSDDYNEEIKKLAGEGKTPVEIYEKLVLKDIQDACDILKPVYDKTHGLDGFVSLEVSPYLAHDTEGSKKEARRLFKAVNRANCFIKIPGTEEGLQAIEDMLYEGVNINITLLFSVKMYEKVAYAYIKALERRVQENKPIDNISSVASFFLSRIDVLVDQILKDKVANTPKAKDLFGKIAIANAKIAYQSFKTIFHGDRWEALKARGAKVQRPLWASTSTKNPMYNDVMYVEPIIGKYTVNTLPEETISAFEDHGEVDCDTVEKDIPEAKESLRDLSKVGIDLDAVTSQLVVEGIQKFIEAYDALIKSISEKTK